jgi:sucrose-6-phosphate hydrolase SacC (GH32 family)
VGGELRVESENLSLHIYIDHSMLEIYANELKGLTTRIYPVRPDADGISLHAGKRQKFTKVEVWSLQPVY